MRHSSRLEADTSAAQHSAAQHSAAEQSAPLPPRRRMLLGWKQGVVLAALLALLYAYQQDLRQALSEVEDFPGDGQITLEGGPASALKTSLRAITGTLSRYDTQELGDLVDAAEGPRGQGASDGAQGQRRRGAEGLRGRGAEGLSGCGAECMDRLAERVGSGGQGGADRGFMARGERLGVRSEGAVGGAYDVGEERLRRKSEAEQNQEAKRQFVKAEKHKIEEAVKQGFQLLDEGKRSDAKEKLKQAKFYRRAELHLMSGSASIANHLATPEDIKKLDHAIEDAPSSTPRKLARIMATHETHRRKSQGAREDSTPKKLEAIMDKHFTGAASYLDKASAMNRIKRHFAQGGGSVNDHAAWTDGGTASVTLPKSFGVTESKPPSPDMQFGKLAQEALNEGREAVHGGLLKEAKEAEGKARFYVLSFGDDARTKGATALSKELKLQFNILSHAVANLERARKRGAQQQLHQNLKVLKAPIQRESMNDFALKSGQEAPQKPVGGDDRLLFAAAVRAGAKAAEANNVDQAQEKLVEARYYADREGLLHLSPSAPKAERRNGHVAKRALKLLARSVVRAEQRLDDGDNGPREPMDDHQRYRADTSDAYRANPNAGRGFHAGSRGRRSDALREANGGREAEGIVDRRADRLEEGRSEEHRAERGRRPEVVGSRGWWEHHIRHSDGGTVSSMEHKADRWESMYKESPVDEDSGLGVQSSRSRRTQMTRAERQFKSLFSRDKPLAHEANGAGEDQRLDDRRADRAESSDCNSIMCLFDKADKMAAHDGMGPSVADEEALGDRAGDGDGISARDFGSKRTSMGTGMHFRNRLSRHSKASTPQLHGVGNLKEKASDTGRGHTLGGAGDASMDSEVDAKNMVRGEEAEDLKHSMSEALTDYKKLLKHEVKKEEKRAQSLPMMAIASPKGKALLPGLTKARSNPADLELRALKGRKTTKMAKPYAGSAAGRPQADSAQELARQLLQNADFKGGPWDEQESSQDVKQAKDVSFSLPQHTGHHFPQAVIPVDTAARPHSPQVVTEAPPVQSSAVQPPRQPAQMAAMPVAPRPFSRPAPHPISHPAPQPIRRPAPQPMSRSTASHPAVDVANLLIGDVAKDLGF